MASNMSHFHLRKVKFRSVSSENSVMSSENTRWLFAPHYTGQLFTESETGIMYRDTYWHLNALPRMFLNKSVLAEVCMILQANYKKLPFEKKFLGSCDVMSML